MTPEEIKKAFQEYSDFVVRDSKDIPVGWMAENVIDILIEAESGKLPHDIEKAVEINSRLHDAEAKLDARLARIKKAQELMNTAFRAALEIVFARLVRSS